MPAIQEKSFEVTTATVTRASELVRSEGRDPGRVAFESAVVSFFVDAADILGIPKSVAAIYGICFASPEPLCYSDLRERLEMSAGSISQGIRILRGVGALKVAEEAPLTLSAQLSTRDPQRRDRFEPDLELRKLVVHYLEERLQKQLESGRGQLQTITKGIPVGQNGSAKVLKMRLKSLQSWHDKTRALLPIAKGFLRIT